MRLRDIVIILPGISGSILQKNGKDLWARSASAVARALLSAGKNLRDLELTGDDPNAEILDDGVRATGLFRGGQVIPGLIKLDGYGPLTSAIERRFEVVRAEVGDPRPANLYEFPYDWRRDCRANAKRLERFVGTALKRWREHVKSSAPKVILIGHSMGGLVSRYFTEVLGGFVDCRALITIGTPHRGSVDALEYLANGYGSLLPQLTDAMRTFTSVYQLLPTYPTVKVNGSWCRAHEAADLPHIDQMRAMEARRFHQEIEDAVERNAKESAQAGYRTIPVVGTHQRTLQSATFADGRLTSSRDLPLANHDEAAMSGLADGDGTVPRISAIPLELSSEWRETFLQARHAAIQTAPAFMADLVERIAQMQLPSLTSFRGSEPRPEEGMKPAIDLGLKDLYPSGVPLDFDVREINCDSEPLVEVNATIESLDGHGRTIASFIRKEEEWRCRLDPLPEGLYRIAVRAKAKDHVHPPLLVDIFEMGSV